MASKTFDKLIEEIGNMSVIDLADFVKALEEKFNVSAAMPMAAAPVAAAAPAAAAAAEEKAEYKVTLTVAGPEPIKTIKAIRQVIPSLNLGDAKKAVEGVPSVLVEASPKADAMKIKETVEAAGAKIQLS